MNALRSPETDVMAPQSRHVAPLSELRPQTARKAVFPLADTPLTPQDAARLLPRFRASSELLDSQTSVVRRETKRAAADGVPVVRRGNQTKPVPSPGELRGVPVTGHGGTSPGTNPEGSIPRLDRDLDRRRRAQYVTPTEPMVAYG
jgi:hypothetical protein